MDISYCGRLEEVKIVLTDFDGTFLDSDHNASKNNANAFGQLAASGVITGVASGRSKNGTLSCLPPSLQSLMKYNGAPGVFLNGGVVYGREGNVLSLTQIPASAQKLLIDKMQELGVLNNILGYTEDRVICLEKNPFTTKNCEVYKEPEAILMTLEEFSATRFIKLVVCGTVDSTNSIRPILEKLVQGHLRCVRPLDWTLEFVHPSLSKAVGAKVLLSHLDLTPNNLLALGDGENDVQLLKMAGVSVAVSNACKEAKEAAEFNTVSNDEEAFTAVAKLVLNAARR